MKINTIITLYCLVHGVQHMLSWEIFRQEIVVVNEIMLQYTKKLFSKHKIFTTKPRITYP